MNCLSRRFGFIRRRTAASSGATAARIALLIGLCGWLLMQSACGTVTPSAAPLVTLPIVAAPDMAPMIREMSDTFALARPGLSIQIGAPGAADLAALQSRTLGIVATALPSDGDGTAGLAQTEIARQPISVIVHPSNSVKNLSLAELRGIYTGQITKWSQVGGADEPIMVLSREASASTRQRMDAALIASDVKLTPNALLLPSDDAMSATVTRRPEASVMSPAPRVPAGVKVVQVEGELPSAAVRGRPYLLWQPIYLVTANPPSTHAGAFVDFARGEQGRRIITAWGMGAGSGSR